MTKKQALPVKKNDIVTVTIEDLTHEGHGVGKVDGYPLFIPLTLPDELVKVKVLKTTKNFGFGKLIELESVSEHRTEPPCPVYDRCGGCQLQHFSYEGQLAAKQKQVRDVLERIGKIKDVPVHPTLGMEDPWRYRNKSQIPVGTESGRVIAGFYATRSHRIVDTDVCLIQEEISDRVMNIVKEEADRFGIQPYDEERHKGVLRHVVVRYGRTSGEVMVVLVTRTKHLPHAEDLTAVLREKVPGLKSIVHNINDQRTNVILGNKGQTIWGSDVIYDSIGEVKFAISARSFYQINPVQTEVLYQKALEYAQLTGEESVIDAYCGIGTISLFLAQKAKKVFGVEIVKQAIEDAKANAELNGFTNTEFEAGPAEEVIPAWHKKGNQADVIVVDPPRKGCDQALLDTMLAMKPKRIVYVSCNPATLARDLRILEDGGYKTQEVQPVDMFPQTSHVECVAWLEIKE
ncbi:23S rRNA (uracil(1939)-C(5))-methyltransferase RlmD [Jeotgalibacillus haloalkalitolerans]|uniref:23S rRNA (Uracil(1939)-C(5))-methyltransferase RlmD n=1 Tax=Jeotgalibacillus haloalkalitolerans TaxID=3104292 RepID=A0ABU5KQQ0_9BACL|nr:23S rRNA (uracil(1939)-C(5))-methyltransferase RlmD [Jeotgalibacillus sp. HH7-29]MDZ5713477.1 23S rRNA (uracil(1939)-C(5))-methyltransferase RlmD [Jeotgalibacillus sp. HH7-29]